MEAASLVGCGFPWYVLVAAAAAAAEAPRRENVRCNWPRESSVWLLMIMATKILEFL